MRPSPDGSYVGKATVQEQNSTTASYWLEILEHGISVSRQKAEVV